MGISLENTRRVVGVGLAMVCLVSGAGSAYYLVSTKPKPKSVRVSTKALEVLARPVTGVDGSWPVVGYGTVRPKHQVNIVPQVTGELIYVHEDMLAGRVIQKGELLFEIDPTIYTAQVAQADAEVRHLEGVIARHKQEKETLVVRIEVAKRILEIEKENFLATKELFENEGVGTSQTVAADEERYLKQQDVVLQLQSRVDLIPHLIGETEAQLGASKARLDQAKYNLRQTKIYCPFEARVESSSAFTAQVVTAHFSIATLTDMSAFEISVGIDPRDISWLDEAAKPASLEQLDGEPAEVVIRTTLRGQTFAWRGYITRFERVDEATRTAKMVVEVRQIDMTARPNNEETDEMSLAIGMYCRAELPGRGLRDAMVVPRHAIYDNECVYIFEDDRDGDPKTGVLARRGVPMLRSLESGVLVSHDKYAGQEACELLAGERVIVSPLTDPIEGERVVLRDTRVVSASDAVPMRLGSSKIILAAHPVRRPSGSRSFVSQAVPVTGN